MQSNQKHVVVLFTPRHTGTHFVRMLLESHPAISTAIGEDYRVHSELQLNYVLAGRGFGHEDPNLHPDHDRSSEPMLLDFFHAFLRGEVDKSYFLEAVGYWQFASSQRTLPRNHREHHLANVMLEFRELGIELAPKKEQYLLYRGHCHQEHIRYDLARLTNEMPVVATIRHPLRSILTILRREPQASHEAVIEDYIAACRCTLSLQKAFLFCTDLWQSAPSKMRSLFDFLGLSVADATEQFLSLRPKVNRTMSKHDRHGQHNYCLEFEHSPEFLGEISVASALLDGNIVHPLLIPYMSRIESTGLIPSYEALGYRFA